MAWFIHTSAVSLHRPERCILMLTYGPEIHKEADEEMIQALAQFLPLNAQAWEI